jgi:hypothetical protein
MAASEQKMRSQFGSGPPPEGAGGTGGSADASSSTDSTDPADTNGDGVVSFSEYIASLSEDSAQSGNSSDLQSLFDEISALIENAIQAYTSSQYDGSGVGSTINVEA